MIFDSNISLKEENWEGNGNKAEHVFISSKQTKSYYNIKGFLKIYAEERPKL